MYLSVCVCVMVMPRCNFVHPVGKEFFCVVFCVGDSSELFMNRKSKVRV